MSKLNKLAQEVHNNAKQKGFYETNRNISELLMLVVSELGEAQEALRKNKRFSMFRLQQATQQCDKAYNLNADFRKMMFECHIKDTFEDEIADAIIRLLDLSAYLKIDIDFHIEEKIKYNTGRDNKHGKAF